MNKLVWSAVALGAMTVAMPAYATVEVGDAFTLSIAGFNSSGSAGYVLGSGLTSAFGSTTTFTNVGYNGQSYTISSWETIGSSSTTNYFKITTPVNFLTNATINGNPITKLQFDIGTPNSGIGVAAGANPLNLASAITGYTTAGSIVYGAANSVFAISPTVTMGPGGMSFAAAEAVSLGTASISGIGVHEFNFSITYANPSNVAAVPEPATWTLMIAGFGAIGFGLRRRAARTLRLTHG